MRPLKLRLENFASYRGAVELDFAPLELFAIEGPTGAGKSSLLDAIIFALYNKVPRTGGQGGREMISLGADRMSVRFDFRAGLDTYRVTRVARRKGAGVAQLEQLGRNGEARPLGDGVQPVNQHIEHLVGLSEDAFTQAVVLPQGEFQRFLKSAPRERRDILTRILRLRIYERMRQFASERESRLSALIQQQQLFLSANFDNATPEALAEINTQAVALGAEIVSLTGRLGQAEIQRDALRAARAKTRELEQRRARLRQLDAEEPKIRSAEERLEAARHATVVLPFIAAAQASETRAARAEQDLRATASAHARAQKQQQEAKKRLQQSAKEAELVPQFVGRIALLDQVIGRMRPRLGLAEKLAEARTGQADTARQLQEARSAQQKAKVELAAARRILVEAEATLTAAPFDAAVSDVVDATREDAIRVANLRIDAEKRAAEMDEHAGSLKAKEVACERADIEVAKANEEWSRASRKLQEVDHKRVEANHQEAAAVLRRGLRINEPCPVCAKAVAEHPPPLATPALDALRREFQRVQKIEAMARSRLDEARTAVARADEAVTTARSSLDQATGRSRAAAAGLARACADLEDRIRDVITVSTEPAIEEQVQDAWRHATAARRRHESVRRSRDDAERTVQTRDRAVQGRAVMLTQLSERLGQQDQTIAGLVRQIAEIDDDVRKVTDAPDPLAEREDLDRLRATLAKTLEECQKADGQAKTEFAAAAARLETSEEARKNATKDAKQSREAALKAALEAGFRDEAAAAEAQLSRIYA
jgi:exonuclease SbcC